MYWLNVVATVLLMVYGVAGYDRLIAVVSAVLYALFIPIVSFFAWHWMLWNAVKTGSSFPYIAYFVAFAGQIIVFLATGAGLISGSAGGILTFLDALGRGKIIASVAVALVTALDTAAFLLGSVVLNQVIR